jgi:hypothetical protein
MSDKEYIEYLEKKIKYLQTEVDSYELYRDSIFSDERACANSTIDEICDDIKGIKLRER